jgi:hypothetical protein
VVSPSHCFGASESRVCKFNPTLSKVFFFANSIQRYAKRSGRAQFLWFEGLRKKVRATSVNILWWYACNWRYQTTKSMRAIGGIKHIILLMQHILYFVPLLSPVKPISFTPVLLRAPVLLLTFFRLWPRTADSQVHLVVWTSHHVVWNSHHVVWNSHHVV